MYKDIEMLDVKSAGTQPTSSTPLTKELVDWADEIFVMEKKHKDYIIENYPEAEEKTIILDIEDKCKRDDPTQKHSEEKTGSTLPRSNSINGNGGKGLGYIKDRHKTTLFFSKTGFCWNELDTSFMTPPLYP